MTATNHVLTGAIIGLTIHQPYLAIPLALASHFVLDSLPHYAGPDHTTKEFIYLLSIDFSFAFLVLFFLTVNVSNPSLVLLCAVLGALPDLMWLPHWLRELAHKKKHPLNMIERFHSRIQQFEHSYNWPYEIIWSIGCILILAKLV